MADDLLDLRRTIALGCRVLAATGATAPLLGHVSLRLPDGRVLVRCRGPRERGLLFTEADDIRVVGLGDSGEGYRLTHEYPIHGEILRACPDVSSVAHARRDSVVVPGLALRPVVGAYNIPAYRLTSGDLPLWPRRGLVRTPAAGRALAPRLGHGVAIVGTGPVQAVLHVLDLEELARVTTAVAANRPEIIPEDDRADLPDLGAAFNEAALWRHHVSLLELRGLADVG